MADIKILGSLKIQTADFGSGGRQVEDTSYTEEITADSSWGHDRSGSEPLAAI